MLLLNAFSLNMLAYLPASPRFTELTLEEARDVLADSLESGVGHADTAVAFSLVLGVEVPLNRVDIALKEGDVAVIGQYRGPRLPEGCHVLPEGATIQWIKLEM